MSTFAMFRDRFKCPRCKHNRVVMRRSTTAGKRVATYCTACREKPVVKAGSPKMNLHGNVNAAGEPL